MFRPRSGRNICAGWGILRLDSPGQTEMKNLGETAAGKRSPGRTLTGWLVGLAVVGVGTVIAFSGAEKTLSCDRTKGSCTLTQKRPIGSEVRRISLNQFSQATVEQSRGTRRRKGTRRTSYRVVLRVGGDRITFSSKSTRPEAERLAQPIKTFLQNPGQPSLKVREDDRQWQSLVGVALAAGGAGWLLLGSVIMTNK